MEKNNQPNAMIDRVVTIAVDVQNDFCPGGSLAVSEGDDVTTPLNQIMERTRNEGGMVIVTRDWHPQETPHFDNWPVHCVENTTGAAFHDSLDVHETDTVISKGTGQADGYSGFEGTSDDGATIEQIIQPRTRREHVAVIIGGLATDYCVRATALDAAKQAERVRKENKGRISVFVARDAIRAVNLAPGDGDKAIQEMKDAGVVFVPSHDYTGKRQS